MTSNENTLTNEGDIRPFDNHASGIEIKPLDGHHTGGKPLGTPDLSASAEEIRTLGDNHASGTRP